MSSKVIEDNTDAIRGDYAVYFFPDCQWNTHGTLISKLRYPTNAGTTTFATRLAYKKFNDLRGCDRFCQNHRDCTYYAYCDGGCKDNAGHTKCYIFNGKSSSYSFTKTGIEDTY